MRHETVAWVEGEHYQEGTLRKSFPNTLVVSQATPDGFGLHILPREQRVPAHPWRGNLGINSRLHVFVEGIWLPAKVHALEGDAVLLTPALTRRLLRFPRTSLRLAMLPPGVYSEGLWAHPIIFEFENVEGLWNTYTRDEVLYEKVDSIFGTAILYPIQGPPICVREEHMHLYTLEQEARRPAPPQEVARIRVARQEVDDWCPGVEPEILLEMLSERSHLPDGSLGKQLIARLFNVQRFALKWHPSHYLRSMGSFGAPTVYLQSMIELLTPAGAPTDPSVRFACVSAMWPDIFEKALTVRLREEQLPYLGTTLTFSARHATFHVSTTGTPVRDPRNHLLTLTPWLRDAGVVHLPLEGPRSSRLTRFGGGDLRDTIWTRERRDIANVFCATATTLSGLRFYDLAQGFVPKHSPVYGGALSVTPDTPYRRTFVQICKDQADRTLVVVHVNLVYFWKKIATEVGVDLRAPLQGGPGLCVLTYHCLRNLQLPRFDRVIFEDSQQFASHTSTVRRCSEVRAPVRWCVSRMPRTSFPALHGTLKMLRVEPFRRGDVHWNNALDRAVPLVGSGPYYNLLRRVFLFCPEPPFQRPPTENRVVDCEGVLDLVMDNIACAPYHPEAFRNLQCAMLSSTLLPFQGFVVDGGSSLEELMGDRGMSEKRRTSLRGEMEQPCPVCLEPLADPRLTACSHLFCKECCDHVADLTNNCPVCRAPWEEIRLVKPLRDEELALFRAAHAKLKGEWVRRSTVDLYGSLEVGPKAREIQHLCREGPKTILVAPHKTQALWLGTFLVAPVLTQGLRPQQRHAALKAFEGDARTLVVTPEIFAWSLRLPAPRVIFSEPPTKKDFQNTLRATRPEAVLQILAQGFPDCAEAMTNRRRTTSVPGDFPRSLALLFDARSLSASLVLV